MDRKRLYDVCEASLLLTDGELRWEGVLKLEIDERKKAVKALEDFKYSRFNFGRNFASGFDMGRAICG